MRYKVIQCIDLRFPCSMFRLNQKVFVHNYTASPRHSFWAFTRTRYTVAASKPLIGLGLGERLRVGVAHGENLSWFVWEDSESIFAVDKLQSPNFFVPGG